MCSPETTLNMQLGGGVASAAGSFFGAQVQKSALNGQGAVADINAKLAEDSAQTALLAGQREEQQVDLKTSALKSQQRASLAGNGIDLTSGTAVNLLTSTDVMGKIDANTVAANAMRTAFGYRAQGVGYSSQATMDRAQASGINPTLQAGTSLLTSAGNFSMSHALLQKQGLIPKDDWYSRTIGKW